MSEWAWMVILLTLVVVSIPVYAVMMQRRDRLQMKHWRMRTGDPWPTIKTEAKDLGGWSGHEEAPR